MRSPLLVALLLLSATSALAAEEPSGCDKFKWPIERERAALTASDRAKLASGSEQTTLPSSAITLGLVVPSEARLPTPPERAPKDGTFAGFTRRQGELALDCDPAGAIGQTAAFDLAAQPAIFAGAISPPAVSRCRDTRTALPPVAT